MNKIFIHKIKEFDLNIYPDYLFEKANLYQGLRRKQSLYAYKLLFDIFKTYFNYELKEDDLKEYHKNIKKHYYSISHSGEYVMVTISNLTVGCDMESIKNLNSKKMTLSKLFNDNDVLIMGKKWCYLESLYKLTQSGTMRSNHISKDINLNELTKIINLDNEVYIIAVVTKNNESIYIFDYEISD